MTQNVNGISIKKTLLGTAAYTLITFPLAVVWHVTLFKSQYERFGYFEDEPSFLLGFLTIVLQGGILSAIYPLFRLPGHGVKRGLLFATVIGAFFWTSHVLAFVAKQSVEPVAVFVAMETAYLMLQFGIFGALVGLIYNGVTRMVDGGP